MLTDMKLITAVKSEVMVMIGSRIRTQISPKDMKGTIKKVTIPNFMMLICINHKANTRISKEMIELILKLKKEEVMTFKRAALAEFYTQSVTPAEHNVCPKFEKIAQKSIG